MTTTYFDWDVVNDAVVREVVVPGSVRRVYVNEPTQYGPRLHEIDAGAVRFYHFDAIGSTTSISNANGQPSATLRYDAWGRVVSQEGASDTECAWIGRWGYLRDSQTGMYYVRVRTYDATLARWASRDSLLDTAVCAMPTLPLHSVAAIAGFGAVADPYGYADQRPVDQIDPSGYVPIVVDADAFIPWDWVNIPPDPRAILKALLMLFVQPLLTRSYAKGDNRNPSPTPMRKSKTRTYSWIKSDTCVCRTSRRLDANFGSECGLGDKSARMDEFFWVGGFTTTEIHEGWGTVVRNTETATTYRSGTGCTTVIRLQATGNVPLDIIVLPIPIDYDYSVYVYHAEKTVAWAVNGSHDGFPAHEFYLQIDGRMVDTHIFVPPEAGWAGAPHWLS